MAKEDRGEEFRLQTAQLAGGSGATLYLQYPNLYHSAVTAALRAVDGNDFETLVRSGVPGGAAITHGMWGSDTYATFSGLRAELRYGISESLTGDFAWGSDTGGIDPQPPATSADAPTPVLFDRWAQFSAVSPVFEVGGAGLNATPWNYPSWAVNDFRDSVGCTTSCSRTCTGSPSRPPAPGCPSCGRSGSSIPPTRRPGPRTRSS